MREYIAVIHKDPEHGYAVTFPDFPGVIAFAAFLEGAPDVAASHLTIHLEEMEYGGRRRRRICVHRSLDRNSRSALHQSQQWQQSHDRRDEWRLDLSGQRQFRERRRTGARRRQL
jgi:predicted RNase H-like HicB family nuclease